MYNGMLDRLLRQQLCAETTSGWVSDFGDHLSDTWARMTYLGFDT